MAHLRDKTAGFPLVKAVLLLLLLFFIVPVQGAFTYDTKATYQTTAWNTANPGNISYTAGSGSTLMVLYIQTSVALRTAGTPTFHGKSFINVGRVYDAAEGASELWYLYLSSTDTGSAYTVSVPNAATSRAMTYQVATFKTTGTPLFQTNTSGTGSGTNPSQTLVSSQDGALYVNSVFDGRLSCGSATSPSTLLYCNDGGAFIGASEYYLQSTAGSQATGFTISSGTWAMQTAVFNDHVAVTNFNTQMTNDATNTNYTSGGNCGTGCHGTAGAGTISISSPKTGLKAGESGTVWVNITGAGTGDTEEWVGIFNGAGTSASYIGNADGWTISANSNGGTTSSFTKSGLGDLSSTNSFTFSQSTKGTYSIYGWIRHGSGGAGAKGYKTSNLDFTIYHAASTGDYDLNLVSGTGDDTTSGSCGNTCHSSSQGTTTISVSKTGVMTGEPFTVWVNSTGITDTDDAQWTGLFLGNGSTSNKITGNGFTVTANNYGASTKNTHIEDGLTNLNTNVSFTLYGDTEGTYDIAGMKRFGNGQGTSHKSVSQNVSVVVYHMADNGAYLTNMTTGTGKDFEGNCGTTCHGTSGTGTLAINANNTDVLVGDTIRIYANSTGETTSDDHAWIGIFNGNSTVTTNIQTNGFTTVADSFGYGLNKNSIAQNELSTFNVNWWWDVQVPSTAGTYPLSALMRFGNGAGGSRKLLSNNISIIVSESSPDTSYTVSLPAGKTVADFIPATRTSTDVEPVGQTSGQAWFTITNTGNQNNQVFILAINSSNPTGITLKADDDNTPAGAITITTTPVTIIADLDIAGIGYVWLWTDFTTDAYGRNNSKILQVDS